MNSRQKLLQKVFQFREVAKNTTLDRDHDDCIEKLQTLTVMLNQIEIVGRPSDIYQCRNNPDAVENSFHGLQSIKQDGIDDFLSLKNAREHIAQNGEIIPAMIGWYEYLLQWYNTINKTVQGNDNLNEIVLNDIKQCEAKLNLWKELSNHYRYTNEYVEITSEIENRMSDFLIYDLNNNPANRIRLLSRELKELAEAYTNSFDLQHIKSIAENISHIEDALDNNSISSDEFDTFESYLKNTIEIVKNYEHFTSPKSLHDSGTKLDETDFIKTPSSINKPQPKFSFEKRNVNQEKVLTDYAKDLDKIHSINVKDACIDIAKISGTILFGLATLTFVTLAVLKTFGGVLALPAFLAVTAPTVGVAESAVAVGALGGASLIGAGFSFFKEIGGHFDKRAAVRSGDQLLAEVQAANTKLANKNP